MKNYIYKINLYNNILRQKVIDETKLNDKLSKDIIIYKNHYNNIKYDLKIIEQSKDIIDKVLYKLEQKNI